MPGLFQDDDYSLAQRGASNASVGGSPTGPVSQPVQQTQDPISSARAEALKNYTNRGFIQKYLAPRVGATGNPDLNTIQAIDQARANDQTNQVSKLNTIGGVNKLMQQLSLAPDEQKPFLAKMFSGPLSQIISGMAEPGHPIDHMTPELLEHLISSGTAGQYSQYHMIFGPNELNQLKRAQMMGAKPEEMDKLGVTMGQQLLAPYKNMIPQHLNDAVAVARQAHNVPTGQEYKESDFRSHLQQMIPSWVQSDPQFAQDPKAQLKLAVAADEWMKDPNNEGAMASAGLITNKTMLARQQPGMEQKTFTREDANKATTAALKQAGWKPETPGYQDAFNIVYGNVAKTTAVQCVGAYCASQVAALGVPPPPTGAKSAQPGVSIPKGPLAGPVDAPLGKDAELYINAKGENPPATMTGRDAQAQGYTPYKEAPKMFEAEQASRLFKQHLEIVKSYADLFPAETGSKVDDLAIAGAAAAKRYTTGQVDPRVTKLAAISLPASLQSIIATVPNARAGARLLSGFEELTNPYRVWTKESYLAAIDGLNSMAETALAQRGRPGMNQPANVPGAATVPPASLTQKSPAVKSVPAPAVVGPAERPSSALTPTHVWNSKTKSLEPVK